MCTLPVNIVNEKIYLILWFAFLVHTILSMLQLLRQAPLIRLFREPFFNIASSDKLLCSWSPSALA
jgi:hypothetical protein